MLVCQRVHVVFLMFSWCIEIHSQNAARSVDFSLQPHMLGDAWAKFIYTLLACPRKLVNGLISFWDQRLNGKLLVVSPSIFGPKNRGTKPLNIR